MGRLSIDSFGKYFEQYSKVYSTMLLLMYFELFKDLLRVDARVRKQVRAVRAEIWVYTRWPELVTFEELNLRHPDRDDDWLPRSLYQALRKNRPLLSPATLHEKDVRRFGVRMGRMFENDTRVVAGKVNIGPAKLPMSQAPTSPAS